MAGDDTEPKVLARPVYLGGVMLPPGTELTAEQAEQINNPKAFQAEPTLADKVTAAQEAYDRAVQDAEAADAATPKDTAAVKDDRAENGAALARAAKAAAAKPTPPKG